MSTFRMIKRAPCISEALAPRESSKCQTNVLWVEIPHSPLCCYCQLVAPRRDRKALGIRCSYPILSYAIVLYIFSTQTSPKAPATRTRNQKTRSKKTTISTLQVLPKPSQNPPQTHPKPSKMEPKSTLGPSKTPFGEPSGYKPQKMIPKSGPRGTKRLQTPPKTVSKSSPNPSKINRKMQSKKTSFLDLFFS